MSLKSLIDDILFYISVPRCVGCKTRLKREEFVICNKCLPEYENIKLRNCSVCSKTLDKCSCANKYLNAHYIHKVIKVFRYIHQTETLPSNNLIYSLKRDNRRDVLMFLRDEMAKSITNTIPKSEIENYIFTNVPRRRKSRIKYGIDHSALLAKALAKYFSAKYYQPLISKSRKAQKKTEGTERMSNAQFAFKKNAKSLKGKKVIIVDDVITTGASMGACAMLLHGLGAKKIIGASISIAYRDSYIPFIRERKR